MIITPNKIELEGEEITDEDISLDLKETELLLKKARLNVGLPVEEPIQEEKQVDKPEPKSTHEDRERIEKLKEINF